jgi:hypothetical protein
VVGVEQDCGQKTMVGEGGTIMIQGGTIMINISVLRALVEAGADAKLLIALIEAIEAANVPVKRRRRRAAKKTPAVPRRRRMKAVPSVVSPGGEAAE